MRRISKGYTRIAIPLFLTMLTAPKSSPSRITSSPSLSPQTHPSTSLQPPTPPFMPPIHYAEEPATMPHDSSQPRVQSLASDEGSLTLNDLTVLYTTLSKKVDDLQNDLKQKKLTYGAAYTKLILRVKKLEHKVKTSKSRRRARVIISDNKEDLEDSYKQGRIIAEIDQNPSISLPTELVEDPGSGEKGKKEISTAKVLVSTASVILEVSTAIPERQVYIRRSAKKRKDKGKAIMKDDEFARKKTKKQLEQERLGLEKAIRLQEQEKYDLAQALELQKELDIRKEGVTETTQAHDIDWSDPAMLRYHAQKIDLSLKLKIIRVGNHTEVYQVFEDMLKRFDRDDLENLWDLVKKKFSLTEPTVDKEKVLWVKLKRLFEPDDDDTLWKLQRYMHDPLTWKLYDTCGVHHVSTERGYDIFMLVEKDYPLTRVLMTVMLANTLVQKLVTYGDVREFVAISIEKE
ncbi:hypothetical protein Tco_0684064 [Tanacetum coccineum]